MMEQLWLSLLVFRVAAVVAVVAVAGVVAVHVPVHVLLVLLFIAVAVDCWLCVMLMRCVLARAVHEFLLEPSGMIPEAKASGDCCAGWGPGGAGRPPESAGREAASTSGKTRAIWLAVAGPPAQQHPGRGHPTCQGAPCRKSKQHPSGMCRRRPRLVRNSGDFMCQSIGRGTAGSQAPALGTWH